MIYVTGDIHGGCTMNNIVEWEEGKNLTHDDYLVIAGDFGIPWEFSITEDDLIYWIESRPWTTLFVDGNHERFSWWKDQPVEEWHGGRVQRLSKYSRIRRLMRGEVFDFDGTTLFTMGGATSVDREWRIEGYSWWPEELPSIDEIEYARKMLDSVNWEVDYVVTHTCASDLLSKTLTPTPIGRTPTLTASPTSSTSLNSSSTSGAGTTGISTLTEISTTVTQPLWTPSSLSVREFR